MELRKKIAIAVCIVPMGFMISSFWWDFGIIVAIGIIIIFALIIWMVEDYDRAERLRVLEEKHSDQ